MDEEGIPVWLPCPVEDPPCVVCPLLDEGRLLPPGCVAEELVPPCPLDEEDEPLPAADGHHRALTRAKVASERSEELGSNDWLHDQIPAVLRLAMELDHESRERAFALVPLSWWQERTAGLAAEEAPPPAVG